MSKIIELRQPTATAPTIKNGEVRPPRPKRNSELRPREYLVEQEVEALMVAAGRLGVTATGTGR